MTEQQACSLTAWERNIVHAAMHSNNNTEIIFTAEQSVDVRANLTFYMYLSPESFSQNFRKKCIF